ncbi:MAG: GNAT family N-acetyltransferase [Acidimicrobiales bacterium]|jgi:GNAT superfamily N-acetyltransferase
MTKLVVRPMTSGEFEAFRSRLVREYAAEHVRAGNWTEDDAEARAAEQTHELLPQGAETPGTLLLMAETADGEPIGHVWVGLEGRRGFPGAWIYSIEIAQDHRGKGYGRALLEVAEQETARRGVTAMGLNVFGPNTVARNLYESAGYEIATLQMHKQLSPD